MAPVLTVADYLAAPAAPADLRVAYGDYADQHIDLYLPVQSKLHPLIILIHGGCWQERFGLAPLEPSAAALRDLGFAVANIEYRRLGGAGGWPQTFTDVAAAADHLRTLAAQHPFDLTRVHTVGHSAGGHLALWLAARAKLPPACPLYQADPLPIQAVIALAALGDLPAAAERQLCGGVVPDLVAHDATNYAWASPAALLPLGVPHTHLIGADDTIVPPEYVAAFVAAAQAAGDPATLIELPATGHFELTTPGTAAWAALVGCL
jgi:acetyl esterase/lipase